MDSGLSTESTNPPRKIGEVTYTVVPLPATASLKILTRLTTIVGQAAIVVAAKGKKGLEELPPDVLTFTVQSILGRLDENEVETTVKELMAGVYVHGTEQPLSKSFDVHFRGKMGRLMQVVQFALEVNYRDFFDAIRSLAIDKLPGSEATPPE